MLKRWLQWLWFNEDGFFGIGMGPSKQEKDEFGNLGSLANFATSQGESAVSAGNNFFKSILSGDMSKIGQVLGPEFSAINRQGQQQKKTAAEFGNRSGGTNAHNQSIDDKTHSAINEMIASLTGGAASELSSSGAGLLGLGTSAHEGAFSEADTIHQQSSAKLNDIFKSIADVAAGFLVPGGGDVIGGPGSESWMLGPGTKGVNP